MSDQTETSRDTLYITDAELIRRMGVPEKIARQTIRTLDADKRSGFPRKQSLFGSRRYWPAVKAYLDRINQPGSARERAESPQERRQSA